VVDPQTDVLLGIVPDSDVYGAVGEQPSHAA